MKIALDTQHRLHFFDDTNLIGAESFQATILDAANTTVHTLTLTQRIAQFPDVYLTPFFKISAPGSYTVRFTYDGTVVHSESLIVVGSLTTDYPLSEPVNLRMDDRVVNGAINRTVKLNIYASDLSAPDTSVANYVAAEGVYFKNTTFSKEGQYILIWTDAAAAEGPHLPVHVEIVQITQQQGLEKVRFVVGPVIGADFGIGANGAAHSGTTLVVSHPVSAAQVAQGVTDEFGEVQLELAQGTYVASIHRSGRVFTTNNKTFIVRNSNRDPVDPNLTSWPDEPKIQAFHFATEVFSPTFTAASSPADMCTLFADIYLMDGQPLINADVYVTLLQKPALYSGTAVFDTARVYRTDSNGHVEFSLVQGIQVEIVVAPLSLRRQITVPSGNDAATPVNIMTLLSSADDVFDVIKDTRTGAPRRSL